MARLTELPIWWLYLALVAAGAVGGALCAAVDLAVRAVSGRRR